MFVERVAISGTEKKKTMRVQRLLTHTSDFARMKKKERERGRPLNALEERRIELAYSGALAEVFGTPVTWVHENRRASRCSLISIAVTPSKMYV